MQGKGRGPSRRWRGTSRRAVRFVEPTLLLLLHYGPAHGYTLIEHLGEYGLADIDPSAIYRVLRDMEDRGWVISSWQEEQTRGPPRRVYRLTPEGDQYLAWWIAGLEQTRQVVDRFLQSYNEHMELEDHSLLLSQRVTEVDGGN